MCFVCRLRSDGGEWLRRCKRFGFAHDLRRHVAEDELMKRQDGIPVEQPEDSARLEERYLKKARAAVRVRKRLELQPSVTRQLHLGAQPQELVRPIRLDTPEIDRIADAQRVRRATSPPRSNSADEAVHNSAELPQPVGIEPTLRAAETAENLEHIARRRRGRPLPAVDQHPLCRT